MTQTKVRQEIVELINGGLMRQTSIVARIKKMFPGVDIEMVKEETKELVEETKEEIKRFTRR